MMSRAANRAGRRGRLAAAAVVLVLAAGFGVTAWRGGGQEQAVARAGTVRAPSFPDGAAWLNTDRPITLESLRGKVVLLDFWTYCCINCMHILPDLKQLERQFADELVVIGVHSAKFADEGDADNIRQAILRYDIEHPVLVDSAMRVWDSYAVRAWPTLVLIDPTGRVVGRHAGEIEAETFAPAIARVIADAEAAGTLDRGPVPFRLEKAVAPRTLLRFPGKVLADAASERLFIADSTHHRYLIVGFDGTVQDVIGSGQEGFVDGTFDQARFAKPQGLALHNGLLYLADTENHAVRVVDLEARSVTTLAGNGRQARRFNQAGQGRQVSLSSPWDVEFVGDRLVVAMAGTHQLWTVHPVTGEARPYAGSGREDLLDGPAFVADGGAMGADPMRSAALAQPSGLATDGRQLYFADSETSSIRSVDLARGTVATWIGQGLFEFGDTDGDRRTARLQHPLGVELVDGVLFVADTYNDKIKRLDLTTGRIDTYAGTGDPGTTDGPRLQAQFDEPAGLSYAAGRLYVADTNNHAIRVIDLATEQVSTLTLRGLTRARPPDAGEFRGTVVAVNPVTVAAGDGQLALTFELPEGYKLNPDAPLVVRVDGGEVAQTPEPGPLRLRPEGQPVTVPVTFHPGGATVRVEADVYYCTEDGRGACLFESVRFEVPLTVTAEAGEGVVRLGVRVRG